MTGDRPSTLAARGDALTGASAIGRRSCPSVRNAADQMKGPGPSGGRYRRDSSASLVGVMRNIGGGSFPGMAKSIGILCDRTQKGWEMY